MAIRIKFKPKQKALDINLPLNDRSKANTNKMLERINGSLRQSQHRQTKENTFSRETQNYIPDDAEILRYDLRHEDAERSGVFPAPSPEKQAEIRSIMKKANREDVFVAMYGHDTDNILAIIKDYMMIYRNDTYDRDMNDNAARILRSAYYILHFKLSEIEGNVEKVKNRKATKQGSQELDRKEYRDKKRKDIKPTFREFMKLINQFSGKKYPHFEKAAYRDLHNGDLFKSLGYWDNSNDVYEFIADEGKVNDYDRERRVRVRRVPRGSLTPEGDEVTERLDVEDRGIMIADTDIMYEMPDLNWREMMQKRQKFPEHLFKGVPVRIERLKRMWNDILGSLVDKDHREENVRTNVQSVVENKNYSKAASEYNRESKFRFRDKSGYLVTLDKHFEQMAELNKGVPAPVKNLYQKAFKEVQDTESKLKGEMQQYLDKGDFDKLSEYVYFAKNYCTRSFNNQLEEVLNEDRYDASKTSSWHLLTQGNSIKKIEKFLQDHKDYYAALQPVGAEQIQPE